MHLLINIPRLCDILCRTVTLHFMYFYFKLTNAHEIRILIKYSYILISYISLLLFTKFKSGDTIHTASFFYFHVKYTQAESPLIYDRKMPARIHSRMMIVILFITRVCRVGRSHKNPLPDPHGFQGEDADGPKKQSRRRRYIYQ